MSEAGQASESNAPQGINLDSLSLEQLNSLKQSEEQRQQELMQRFAQLRAASARLSAAKNALSTLNPASADKEIMVPLTESLYCPGRVKNPDRVMVELGTGYYVERSSKDAANFLERRRKIVDANSENISTVVQTTRRNAESIAMAMQGKMMGIRARQEGAKFRAKEGA